MRVGLPVPVDLAEDGWNALGAHCIGAHVGLGLGLAFGLTAALGASLAALGSGSTSTASPSESSESDSALRLMRAVTPAEAPVPLVASRSSVLIRLHDKP